VPTGATWLEATMELYGLVECGLDMYEELEADVLAVATAEELRSDDAGRYDDEEVEVLDDAASEGLDDEALGDDAAEEDEAGAAEEELLDPLPVGVSPSRMQPVLSVSTFGQVICL